MCSNHCSYHVYFPNVASVNSLFYILLCIDTHNKKHCSRHFSVTVRPSLSLKNWSVWQRQCSRVEELLSTSASTLWRAQRTPLPDSLLLRGNSNSDSGSPISLKAEEDHQTDEKQVSGKTVPSFLQLQAK